MIPKVIHYCWFGGNPLPEDARKCINSWKKYCNEFEIIEWNESNFDVNICKYTQQAVSKKKWAFVSDYARFWILYNYGGLYFDTDVEIIKPINQLMSLNGFMGVEKGNGFIAPGLGLGFEKGNKICEEILNIYNSENYVLPDGSINKKIVVDYATEVMKKYGFDKTCNNKQLIQGITIFPYEYFCPMDYKTGLTHITSKTFSIHHYSGSWLSKEQNKILHVEMKANRLFGKKIGHIVERVYSLPYRVKSKIKTLGIKSTIKFIFSKVLKRK